MGADSGWVPLFTSKTIRFASQPAEPGFELVVSHPVSALAQGCSARIY